MDDEPGPTTDLLRDPRVKAFFLNLLASPLPDEVKYQKFVDFCARQGVPLARAEPLLDRALPPAGEELCPAVADLLPRAAESIHLAVRWVLRSQHQEGGWGAQTEQSSFWHTAYTLLFLKSAQEMVERETAAEIEGSLRRGTGWLEQHPEGWAPDTIPGAGGLSVYDAGLMVLCFYRVGRTFMRREPALRVYRGLDRLYHAQNEDGGWDASLWGYEVATPVRVWSEVGATSWALRAMTETHDERFQSAVSRGIQWLVSSQNPDGSWNDGSCHPFLPDFQIEGSPSLIKTCAALQGILASEALDLPLYPYAEDIHQALAWLRRMARPILERRRKVTRWGLGYTCADYERVTAVLELLLSLPCDLPDYPGGRVPIASPADLAPYAAWLLDTQRRQPGDPENGGWVLGHTARIGLALAGFYRRAKAGTPETRIPWIP